MPKANHAAQPQATDPRLQRTATVLVIVCAIAFLLLWAVPTLSQKSTQAASEISGQVDQAVSGINKESIKSRPDYPLIEKALLMPEFRAAMEDPTWILLGIQVTQVEPGSRFYEVLPKFDNGSQIVEFNIHVTNTSHKSFEPRPTTITTK